METCLVYVTVPSTGEARVIARLAVEQGLAACANILPGMESVYRWQGRTCEDQETILILKTRRDRFEALATAVREAHPADCPCIVALPIEAGHQPFLDWIADQTGPK